MIPALAAALLLHAQTAQDMLTKLEEALESAETVAVKVNVAATDRSDPKKPSLRRSSWTFLAGRREAFRIERTAEDSGEKIVTVFDGQTAQRTVTDRGKTSPADLFTPPEGYSRDHRIAVVRLGLEHVPDVVVPGPGRGPVDIRTLLPVSEVAFGAPDGGLQTITYIVKDPADAGNTFDVRVWFDPKTLKPTKRAITRPTSTEIHVFEDLRFNPPVPEEKFRLEDSNVTAAVKVEATLKILEKVSSALDRFKADLGTYPAMLKDLVQRPETVPPKLWPPQGYLGKEPTDAWNRSLVYRVPGGKGQPFDLVSLARDGKEGGESYDGDLQLPPK